MTAFKLKQLNTKTYHNIEYPANIPTPGLLNPAVACAPAVCEAAAVHPGASDRSPASSSRCKICIYLLQSLDLHYTLFTLSYKSPPSYPHATQLCGARDYYILFVTVFSMLGVHSSESE